MFALSDAFFEFFSVILPIFERGLLFSFVVTGLYITSRILHRDDLTTEGSFGFAGAITAWLLAENYSPIWATVAGMLAGAFAGFLTGFIHTKIGVNHVISGLIVTSALFSLQLKVVGAHQTLDMLIVQKPFFGMPVIIFGALAIITCLILWWFLQTEIGLVLRAVGTNPLLILSFGKSSEMYIVGGFMLANLCTGLAGSLFVQYTGFFSIWAGFGVLVIGLAGLILGELYSTCYGAHFLLSSCIYQIIIFCTYELNIDPDLNKAVTGLFILLLLSLNKKRGLSYG